MASRNDVAEAAAELRRRVGMAQRGRRPSRPRDGRTVLLVGQMHGGAHAARTGNAHGIRGPVGRGPGPVHRRKGMDRIAGLTGWRGPRPWTMDPAMTDTGEDHTLEGMWPEPGPGVDDEWRADLDHDDGAGPRAVGMDRIIEGIWAEDHRGRNGADHGWWSLDEGARP